MVGELGGAREGYSADGKRREPLEACSLFHSAGWLRIVCLWFLRVGRQGEWERKSEGGREGREGKGREEGWFVRVREEKREGVSEQAKHGLREEGI